MKKILLLFLFVFVATFVSAQSIVKGDMNEDDVVDVSDVTMLVSTILGNTSVQSICLAGSPYEVDNSLVVGTWYAPDGTSFSFNDDGTTTFPNGATYEYMPSSGRLLVYDATGHPVKVLPILKVEPQHLITMNFSTGVLTHYTNQKILISDITLSQTSLAMNSGTSAQLTATVTPKEAFANINWRSSNESVATVDANGLVTAVAGGTTTIICVASDGSGMTATCEVTVTQMVTSIVLSQTTAILELEDFVRLTATVLPNNAANKNVTWSSSNVEVAPVRNGRVDAYDYGTAIITCTAQDGSGVMATCKVNVPKTEYVDLGLPSGTLWATCNVGTYSPDGYGDYFAWGEVEPQADNTYSWTSYKYAIDNYNKLTKYCFSVSWGSYGNNGFSDNLTELEFSDDAAYVNWGGNWRIPSNEQLDELTNENYTTSEWTALNGVYGCNITSKSNGNFIFLPAAGCRCDSLLYLAGSGGYYWSRTLYSGNPVNAQGLRFDSSDVYTGFIGSRYYGQSVRPVRLAE